MESSALRPEQMLSAAQTHFTAANLHLVVVGPYNEDDRKQVEQRLAAYGG